MNTTAPVLRPAAEILRLLVAGKTAQQAADLSGWPKHRVVVLIQSTDGWRYDPNKDTAYQAGTKGKAPLLPDGIPATAPRIPEMPKPAPPATPAVAPAEPAPVRNTIDALLAAAAEIEDKAVQRELGKVLEQLGRLRQTVATVTERRQAEQAIETLERQLAEAKARAKELGVRRTTASPAPPAGGPSTMDIRKWAAEHDIDCPARGKIPAAVREAYDARGDQ